MVVQVIGETRRGREGAFRVGRWIESLQLATNE
jgi:hypothetical protein